MNASRLRTRARALFHRDHAEADLDDELRFHLDMETEHLMRMGLPEKEARRRARVEFGNVERYRDETRDARGIGAIEDFMRDVRISMRSLRRAPAFALISILTVALGVGTTTAVFSLIDGILLRPLPYPNPNALVRIYERQPKYPASSFSGADFLDVERESKTLESVAFFADWQQAILGLAEPVRADVAGVSARFFDVMGVAPAKGRGFLPGEGRTGEMRTAVVSDRFWRETLGARTDWNTMLLHTDIGDSRIVGIMPAGFSYPSGADVWVATVNDNPSRTAHGLSVIGRMKQGKTIDDVRTELDHLFGGLKAQLGKEIDAEGVAMRTLRESLTLRVKTLMFVLLSAVSLVLLVACTNLASANLARGEGQQRELAVRASLGASRGRLIRQLATEKIVLCLAGGVLGIALALILVRMAVTLGPGTLPAFATVAVDVRVMAFGLLISIATGLITGIAPALRVTHDLRSLATSGGGGAGKRGGFRRPLITAEVALATVLLIGAGLFLRSFATLLAEDPGYRIEHIELADIALPASSYANKNGGYGDTIAITRFYSGVLSRLRQTSGVDAVGMVSVVPLKGGCAQTSFMIDGGVKPTGSANYCVVDSAYFGAMGIPVVLGRIFTSLDRPGTEHVAIINRQAAEMYWAGTNPIGHRIRPPGMDSHADSWLTIVGVIGNVKEDGLDQPAAPQMYIHYMQRPERLMNASIVVRTSRPAVVGPMMRRVAKEADRNALVEVRTLQSLADQSVAGRRFSMTVLSAFSVLALFLAAVGIYGVLAYAVVHRQREIGVRMALGASGGDMQALILGDAMRAVLPGLAMGLIGAYFATRLISGMLYGIGPLDPMTFVITPVVILVVSLGASILPAWRAARVDPMLAMRAE